MRILHLLDHSLPLHSGYVFRTCAILAQQQALGLETFQLTSAKHNVTDALLETVDGLTFYRTPPASGLLQRIPVAGQLSVIDGLTRRMQEVVAEVKPDILHAHSPALVGVAALRVAKRQNLPLVYECRAFWEDAAVDHGTAKEGSLRYRASQWLETYVFRHAQAVTTICSGLRDEIVQRGIPAEKVTVIPNAVDVDTFNFGAGGFGGKRAELGLDGKLVLGFVGSFYAYEGLSLLLQALPLILCEREDVRVLLVGGGPQEQALVETVAKLNLQESVVFAGCVPHEQVRQYYNLIDVLVYPRLAMRLTHLVTPLKPLEAMAQGRLLVASDVGGHRELIADGVNGVLFKAGDPADLAATILELLRHEEHWPMLKSAARRFVEQERNWQASIGRYLPLYESLAHSKH